MYVIFFLGLLSLGFFIFIKYQKYQKVNQLYQQAKELEMQLSNHPPNIAKLKQALAIYNQCSKLINHDIYARSANECQAKIYQGLRFQDCLVQARKEVSNKYYKKAFNNFQQAQKILSYQALEIEINQCHENIKREEQYEKVLLQVNQIARQGYFQKAINLLISANNNFPRQDGEKLLNKLETVIKAQDLYQLGLIAEDKNNITSAIKFYQQALEFIPNYPSCKLRLAIICLESNPQASIDYLQKRQDEAAIYIRGFAHTKLKNWQRAKQEWSLIDTPQVIAQYQKIDRIIEQEQLLTIKEIEKLINEKKLNLAQKISLEFLEKYDSDTVIKSNLENHIQPLLEHQLWDTKDWQKIVTIAEKIWLEKQDIKSLHNWAIATYYQAQINPNKIIDFMIAWLTALANIKLNPTLQNIPWLGSQSIDLSAVTHDLKQILENIINLVKEQNLEAYLALRDIYRLDLVMLSMAEQQNCGIKTPGQLIILPNCYHRFKSYFLPLQFNTAENKNSEFWQALYTDWGMSIAACYLGDAARGIKIQPQKNPVSSSDRFAYCILMYYEGCHYLENLYWRKAFKSLDQAKLAIIAKPDWMQKIDHLCNIQRQQIRNLEEHLEFSQAWYFLVSTSVSTTYYVDYQAMQIGLDVDQQKLSFQQGINQLQQLQNIDVDNSLIAEMIITLSINSELETINQFWQTSNYEQAVQIAQQSEHDKVRFAVAEVCLEIVLEILQTGDLTHESIQSLQKITGWAYSLCPREPSFQETYNQLKYLGIHH